MKIAILGSRGIPASYGGFETFAEGIATRLVAEGHEVTVYCEWGKNTPDSYCGVKLVHVKVPGWGGFSPVGYDLRCMRHARGKYDVVYMLGYSSSPFFRIVLRSQAKLWVNMDGMEWRRSKYPGFAKLYLRITEWLATRAADHLIFDAHAIASYYRSAYRKLPPFSVIAYGTEIADPKAHDSILEKWELTAHKYYLLICRLVPENHILEVIQGYVESASGHPLVIVGHVDPDYQYFRDCQAAANDSVKFVGTLYDPIALGELRSNCLGYFHGHSVGGTNPSLIEAMLYGAMVIAHDNPFNREVTDDAAWYFASVADIPRIIGIIENQDVAPIMERKKALQERASNDYSWNKILSQYLQLLAAQD